MGGVESCSNLRLSTIGTENESNPREKALCNSKCACPITLIPNLLSQVVPANAVLSGKVEKIADSLGGMSTQFQIPRCSLIVQHFLAIVASSTLQRAAATVDVHFDALLGNE